MTGIALVVGFLAGAGLSLWHCLRGGFHPAEALAPAFMGGIMGVALVGGLMLLMAIGGTFS